MPDLPASPFWSKIDAALVVNLKHRDDRWQRMHGILSRHLPEERIVRVDAQLGVELPGYQEKPWFTAKTPEPVAKLKAGSAGCCLSHRKAIGMAKDAGYQRFLLLEDDADFLNELNTPEGDGVAEVLADDAAWDMFYLGFYQRLNKHHVVKKLDLPAGPLKLMRIRGPLMLHAAIINHRIYDKLLAGLPTVDNIWPWMTYWGSIDSWIYNKFGRDPDIKIWGTDPRLVLQVANYSDICDRVLSVEESQGTHRQSKLVPLDAQAFERSIPLSPIERFQQGYKRRSRLIKSRLFGYTKT